MKYSNNEVATYLFCAPLLQTKTKALTIIEWNELVRILSDRKLGPEILLTINDEELLELLNPLKKNAQKERIINKISQRRQLGIAMFELEELTNQGYYLIFRAQMPKRLKKLEAKLRPAFFYAVGDSQILNSDFTLGVVGSRNATKEELSAIESICTEASNKEIVIVSGGAKGVDLTATTAALKNGGKAVIFPSTGLGEFLKSKDNLQYIQNGQLLVLSTQPTYTRFTGAYAMERNKFIHVCGDNVLIGASDISAAKKSGTWEGVQENIKYNWSPLYAIGESRGVRELLGKNQAELYISLEKMYAFNKRIAMALEKNLEKLLKNALNDGLGNSEIVDILNKFTKTLTQTIESNKVELDNVDDKKNIIPEVEEKKEQLKLDV